MTYSLYSDKKDEIWLSPKTKAPTFAGKSKKQRDNTKTPKTTFADNELQNDTVITYHFIWNAL